MKPKFIRLRNFKSIGGEAQTIELAPITLLFGPNSAGKSTVLQSLIYLREILLHRNYDPDKTALGGEWLDLGGFRNLIHGRDLGEAVEISLGFELEGDQLPDYLSDHEREEFEEIGFEPPEAWLGKVSEISITISMRWSEIQRRPFVELFESRINGLQLARIRSTADGRQIFLEQLDTSHPAFSSARLFSDDDSADLTFQERFSSILSSSTITQATRALDSLLMENRPFARNTLAELEELRFGAAKGRRSLLEKISEELSKRTTRRAAELNKSIKDEIQTAEVDGKLGYIGLNGQNDALPDLAHGLRFDQSVWADEDEISEEVGMQKFQLLCESLISGLVAGPLKLIGNWLDEFSYIGPLRDLPARNMEPQRTPDKARWAKGLNAWEFLHFASEQQIKEINYWLGENCLNTGYQAVVYRYRELSVDNPLLTYLDHEVELDQQLMLKEMIENIPIRTRMTLREQDTGLDVMPQDIGVGISQLFPVVVLTVIQETGLIAIEQPELHVHPAIQVELADLFARYAIEHKKLMLLETHSEHLMLRLLRRIREVPSDASEAEIHQSLDKDSVSVVYVQPSAEGTTFKRLRIDDRGDFLDEWPQGFFDERDKELFF